MEAVIGSGRCGRDYLKFSAINKAREASFLCRVCRLFYAWKNVDRCALPVGRVGFLYSDASFCRRNEFVKVLMCFIHIVRSMLMREN